jgi:hypothetical protein
MRSGLAADTYTASITDENGCELVLSPTVSCESVLAVELLDFKVQLNKDNEAVLTWHTTNESQFSHYEVLRMNEAGQWTNVNDINALHQAHNDYQWIDQNLNKEFKAGAAVYYQLKMVNTDGSFDLSKIESVKLPVSAGAWTLYPNPTSTSVDIVFGTAQDVSATIQVFSIEGKLMKTFSIANPAINGRLAVDVSDLSTGVYLVQLKLVEGTRQLKLMVK